MQLIAAQLNGTHIGQRVTIHPSPVLSITGKVRSVIHTEVEGDGGAAGFTYVRMLGAIPDDRLYSNHHWGDAYRLDALAPVFVHTPTPTPATETRTA